MTTDSAAVRWGDGRRADLDFAREQILDAAWHCYQHNSIYKTSMEHIAREARVSRTTIYRYFQNRDEVLTGVILREVRALIAILHRRFDAVDSLAEYLVEMMSCISEEMPQSALIGLLLQEGTAVTSRVCISSTEIFELASTHLRAHFERDKAANKLRPGIEFAQLVDWAIHVMAAYVLSPSPLRGSPEWKRMLWRFLIPAIVRDSAIPTDKR